MSQLLLVKEEELNLIQTTLNQILEIVGNKPKPKDYLSAQEASDFLSVSVTTLWTYRKQGKIQAHKIGRRLYLKKSDLENLIEQD